jgi:hypothetical protein
MTAGLKYLTRQDHDLCCVNASIGYLVTSSIVSIAPLTLAFAVVVCRMLPAGCRMFACSPPVGLALGGQLGFIHGASCADLSWVGS